MPHPQSLYRSSSADVSEGLGAFQDTQDKSRTKLPLCLPTGLTSTLPPRPAVAEPRLSPTHQPASQPTPDSETDSEMQWSSQSHFTASHAPQDASDGHGSFHFAPGPADIHDYTYAGLPYTGGFNPSSYLTEYSEASCPRSLPLLEPLELPNFMNMDTMPESHPPSAYQLDPQLPPESIDGQFMQLHTNYDIPYVSNPSISLTEHATDHAKAKYESDLSRTCTPNGDNSLRLDSLSTDAADEGTAEKDLPYAQLIYRALMEAPNHTMILRDIYDWFKANTDKAVDKETKGWQNSIRHNLSMNGAFVKVDQPYEDTRKGFMWRLSETAIRDGVKSTTRYRNKNPHKRGQRSQHAMNHRQVSGTKGTRRSTRARKGNEIKTEYRSEPVNSTPIHSPFPLSFATDASISYPSSPYYSSDIDFGSPILGSSLDAIPMRSYPTSPFQNRVPTTNAAYMLGHNVSDPLNLHSPSPSVDDPRTPISQGDRNESVAFGSAPCVFDELLYHEYAG